MLHLLIEAHVLVVHNEEHQIPLPVKLVQACTQHPLSMSKWSRPVPSYFKVTRSLRTQRLPSSGQNVNGCQSLGKFRKEGLYNSQELTCKCAVPHGVRPWIFV